MTQYKIEMRDVDRRSWNDVGQSDDAYLKLLAFRSFSHNHCGFPASCKETTVIVENCGIEVEHEYVFRFQNYFLSLSHECVSDDY